MFDPALFSRAQALKSERRAERKAMTSRRRDEIYRDVPEIADIDAQMQSGLLRAVRVAFVGGLDGEAAIEACRERNMALKAKRSELLVEQGYPLDALEDRPECLLCDDTGFSQGKPCACLKQIYTELQNRMLAQKVDIDRQSFDTFDVTLFSDEPDPTEQESPRDRMRLFRNYCEKYAHRFGPDSPNLLLQGDPGLGKTFLCACIAGAVSARAHWVIYETVTAALSYMEAEKFARDSAAGEQAAQLFDCELLILDDLGAEFTTPFVQSALHHLLSTRLSAHRKTIVATALGERELRGRYNALLSSRLESFELLPLFGTDLRRR